MILQADHNISPLDIQKRQHFAASVWHSKMSDLKDLCREQVRYFPLQFSQRFIPRNLKSNSKSQMKTKEKSVSFIYEKNELFFHEVDTKNIAIIPFMS